MKIIPAKEFNAEWLRSRFFVCELPTEFVIPCRYTGVSTMPPIRRVYGYRLPHKLFPYKNNNSQIAIEVYINSGDDGHVDYTFQEKFIIMYDTEIFEYFNIINYEELIASMYEIEQSDYINDRQ